MGGCCIFGLFFLFVYMVVDSINEKQGLLG